MPTKIQSCTCVSEFQDKRYGKNMRVMNTKPSKDKTAQKAKCSVCGRLH